jgi:hypothetical protein
LRDIVARFFDAEEGWRQRAELGMTPASEPLLALTITMKRIVVSPF